MPGAAVVLDVTELSAVARAPALAPEPLPGPELGAVAPVSAGLLLAPGDQVPALGPSVARLTLTSRASLHQGPAHTAIVTVTSVVTRVRISYTGPVIA